MTTRPARPYLTSVLGALPTSRYQPSSLRFGCVVWPDLDRLANIPLGPGMLATLDGVAGDLRRAVTVVTEQVA